MIPRGLFVTGTDTSVGKTRVAAAIVRSLVAKDYRVGALKPVSTSSGRSADGSPALPDAEVLTLAMKERVASHRVAPMVLSGEVAPPVAARLAGGSLDHRDVVRVTREAIAWWAGRCEVLVVEGVGGLLCPLAERSTVVDLALEIDYPLVIVARRGLGTLNHTLLTVECARSRGLRVAGVVLNGSEPTTNAVAEATNPGELARRLGLVPILADQPHAPSASARLAALEIVDWSKLAAHPRFASQATTDPIPEESAG